MSATIAEDENGRFVLENLYENLKNSGNGVKKNHKKLLSKFRSYLTPLQYKIQQELNFLA